MQVNVTITGLDEEEARLTALSDGFKDFTGALTGLGASLILFYGDDVFNSSGQALGETWAPLSTPYDSWKNAHYPGRGVLEREGTMRQSFYSEVTPDTLFIGNSAPYFAFNQLGTGANRGSSSTISFMGGLARSYAIGGEGRGRNLPARPMLGVNSKVEALIQVAIENDIRAKIKGSST